MAGLDKGTHAYEAAGSDFDTPEFFKPRSYTFKPGMTLPIAWSGRTREQMHRGVYCEVLFAQEGGFVVVSYGGQEIVVPQGNSQVQVGPNLLVKYDHPRVKLIPVLGKEEGFFRAGLSLAMTVAQREAAKAAIKAAQGPTYELTIEEDDEAEEVRPALGKNPTLVAGAPEVLRTYHDKGEKWIAPEGYQDEILILEEGRVLWSGRLRMVQGKSFLLREGRDPVQIDEKLMLRVRDHGVPGEPVKAVLSVVKGSLVIDAFSDSALQIGSRDQIYKERLAALGALKEPLQVSGTSAIYPQGTGVETDVVLDDPERVIRMIPIGNWELGATVALLVHEGFVTLRNQSTSNRELDVTRVMPNGPAVVIRDQAHVQLWDDRGRLRLAVIAMSPEVMRISDSLGRPSALRKTTLDELKTGVPGVSELRGKRTIVPLERPQEPHPMASELAERPGCLPAPIAEALNQGRAAWERFLSWIKEESSKGN